MKILCAGGGSLGPVTPLLTVCRALKRLDPSVQIAWATTPNGPECAVLTAEGYAQYPVPVAKLPRYISFAWLTFPRDYLRAKRAAEEIIEKEKPNLVVSFGGFTATPVIRAAAAKGIRSAIHQLDVEPGLTNKLVAPLASCVTTTFAYDVPPFGPRVTTEQVPTPCRFTGVDASFPTRARPLTLVMGGGTGALALNVAITQILDELLRFTDVVHITGAGKSNGMIPKPGYRIQESFTEEEMKNVYAESALVVSRAGMGSITELAACSKATIVVPMPTTHQEKNVEKIADAVVRVSQDKDLAIHLKHEIQRVLENESLRIDLGKRLHEILPVDDGTTIAKKWLKSCKEKAA